MQSSNSSIPCCLMERLWNLGGWNRLLIRWKSFCFLLNFSGGTLPVWVFQYPFLPSFEKALSLLSGNYLCSFARILVTLGAEFSTTTPSKALVDGKLPTHILFSRILGCGDSSSRHIFKQFWGSMLFSVNQVPRAL